MSATSASSSAFAGAAGTTPPRYFSTMESERLAESQQKRIERQEQRLAKTEEGLVGRVKEIDERDNELLEREARLEADYEIRLEKLEQREAAAIALEERLAKKEAELADYVGQLQAKLDDANDAEWWAKQLGRKVGAKG